MKYLPILILPLIAIGVHLLIFNEPEHKTLVDNASVVETVSDRTVVITTQKIQLPLSGSAPTENVLHTIPIEEIKQGCFRQDCIPSVDTPEFVSVDTAAQILPPESIGISLLLHNEKRFYPFPMLETHELVNDFIGSQPVLVSYCPLCGTGIVFDRVVEGETQEFGVSGMLWQSNLLMYNRASDIEDRNLWSQVLGQAVVGKNAGDKLKIIPSDIMRFGDWETLYPDGQVLYTGEPKDPYNGNYYQVARAFDPNFDESRSALPPTTYVYGIEVEGVFKAYPRDTLATGVTKDVVADTEITITKSEGGEVSFSANDGQLPDVEGFWFSWIAAHPNSLLFE